jgi:hypothetical protein
MLSFSWLEKGVREGVGEDWNGEFDYEIPLSDDEWQYLFYEFFKKEIDPILGVFCSSAFARKSSTGAGWRLAPILRRGL